MFLCQVHVVVIQILQHTNCTALQPSRRGGKIPVNFSGDSYLSEKGFICPTNLSNNIHLIDIIEPLPVQLQPSI